MGIKFDSLTGTWSVAYTKRHPVTRQPAGLRRIGIKTEAKAKREYANLIVQVEQKLKASVMPTWAQLLKRYLDAGLDRGLTKKTIYDARTCLEAHTLMGWGERFVDSITTQEIRDLLDAKVGHRRPSHQKHILKCIRAVFTHGIEIGVLGKNPAPVIKFKTGDKIKMCLTEEQVGTLLTKAKVLGWEWYPHYAVAIYTGMRSGELYALTWDKVNLDLRTILVNCSWNSKDGFKSTKSGDDRVAEIAPPLIPLLKELKLQTGMDSNFVLPRLTRWDSGEQARELRMFLLGIGLPQINFHDLRATWATLMLSRGIDPAKVMIMGGWKNIATMMIYMRKAGVSIRGITDKLILHNPSNDTARVLKLESRSKL